MDLMLFCLLVAWFATGRAVSDLRTVARRGLAWAGDRVAGLADRGAGRAPWLAGHAARLARSGADRLRNRPSPLGPRTSEGQRVLDGAGSLAVAGIALLLVWVRVAVADAIGAARAAQLPRPAPRAGRWGWVQGWFSWARWPREGEPHAPVRATATRTDRPGPLALPAASAAAAGSTTEFTTHWRKS